MKEGDEDFTVMRIKISGKEDKKHVQYTYTLLDRYQNDTISMARRTGFTCTSVANLILENKLTKPGISPPEYLGDHYEFISNYLKKRSVIYEVSKKTIENTN